MIFIVHWRDRARICLCTRSQSSVKIDKEKGKDICKGNIHLSHISEHLMHFIPTSKSTFAANLQLFFNKKNLLSENRSPALGQDITPQTN